MSKNGKAVETEGGSPVLVTLQEFCIRLSETETRVELIAGFEADERLNNRKKGTAAEFSARFQAFLSRPA